MKLPLTAEEVAMRTIEGQWAAKAEAIGAEVKRIEDLMMDLSLTGYSCRPIQFDVKLNKAEVEAVVRRLHIDGFKSEYRGSAPKDHYERMLLEHTAWVSFSLEDSRGTKPSCRATANTIALKYLNEHYEHRSNSEIARVWDLVYKAMDQGETKAVAEVDPSQAEAVASAFSGLGFCTAIEPPYLHGTIGMYDPPPERHTSIVRVSWALKRSLMISEHHSVHGDILRQC